jgi:hypothetical protein
MIVGQKLRELLRGAPASTGRALAEAEHGVGRAARKARERELKSDIHHADELLEQRAARERILMGVRLDAHARGVEEAMGRNEERKQLQQMEERNAEQEARLAELERYAQFDQALVDAFEEDEHAHSGGRSKAKKGKRKRTTIKGRKRKRTTIKGRKRKRTALKGGKRKRRRTRRRR